MNTRSLLKGSRLLSGAARVNSVSVGPEGQLPRWFPGSGPLPQSTKMARRGGVARQPARVGRGSRSGNSKGLAPVAFRKARREYFSRDFMAALLRWVPD